MHSTGPQPTARRVASLLWFPFFFAAAFSLMSLFAFHHPEPHDMQIGVVGSSTASIAETAAALDRVAANGFVVTAVATAEAGRSAVEDGDVAAVIDGSTVYVSTAASSTRADYLTAIAPGVVGPAAKVVDVRPTSSEDVSGVSIFFYGLPVLLVGMITSIVLVQLGMWPVWKKVATIAATGAFASVFTYLLARALDVIPADGWLIVYAFLLTQAIGWLTTVAALHAKQFFMPIAMTFVLILGIPSSGGTVNADMLPGFIGWLNSFLPYSQFINAARASAYQSDTNLLRPLLILGAWAAVGGALLAWTAMRVRVSRAREVIDDRAAAALDSEQHSTPLATLHGTVSTTSGRPVAGGHVIVLDESGAALQRTRTDALGRYSAPGLTRRLHHVVVTARHCEPEIATIAIGRHDIEPSRDFRLLDWDDPAGNLTAEELGAR